MRKGKSAIFYVPTVYNPKSNATEPLPMGPLSTSQSESRAGGSIYDEGPDRSGHLFPSVTIDPLSIAIAKPDPKYQDGTGFEPEDSWRQHNMLTTIRDEGLHVSPYKDAYATSIPNDAGSRLVTLQNIRDAFSDCDGKLLSEILEHPGSRKATPVKIATCENLESMKQEIRSLISEVRQTLVDMQNQLQQEIDSKFDGSNATPDIKDDLDNAGTSSTSDYEPKPMRVLAAECRHGHDSDVTRYYAVAVGLTPDTTYAIDQYIANPLRAEPAYLGTHYVQSNSSGQVSRHVRMYHGGNFGDEPRFVLRTLRADESHKQGQGIPYQGQCQY